MNKPLLKVTHEKHLDHLVRVVPVIVFAYALQCYFLAGMGPIPIGANTMIFLGVALGLMISGFVAYDMKHQVEFYDDHFLVQFGPIQKSVKYDQITLVEGPDDEQNFSNLTVRTRTGQKLTFYFIDEAPVVKKWLQAKRSVPLDQAA